MKIPAFLLLFALTSIHAQEKTLPIIDMHLHSYERLAPNMKASWAGEEYAQKLTSPNSAEQHFFKVLDEMEKNNIVLGVNSSTSIKPLLSWTEKKPELFISGIQTNNNGHPILSPDSLKLFHEQGIINVLGELGLQYHGIAPDDPMMASYYKVAEENGIPVCLHTGLGPPGGPHSFAPKFRTTLGKPSLFEEVLVKHPNLKAFLAHAGWPYISETIALMYIYPELYVDLGVLAWALPKKAFYSSLQEMMNAGFGKRIMFGSDQMMWPEAISISVKTIEEAPFLNEEEKRDIFYNNAAKFLGLSDQVIAGHHSK